MDETPNDASNVASTGGVTLRRAVINLTGFAIGLGLFVWIVMQAIQEGDWGKLRGASTWLILILLGCTAASGLINGATFWVTIRPIRPMRMLDLQLLNLTASLLNYAPLRLGAISRVAYHLRVDGLSLLQVGAWFMFIGYILMLGVGSCVVATLLVDQLDWRWLTLVGAQMVLGAWVIRIALGYKLLSRYTQGLERMATDPGSLWGAVILRALDLAAYAGRMAAAAAILGMTLPATHIVLLAVVAIAASLVPFGRLGFREACVALTAKRLEMMGDQVESAWAQLALVESMGEVLVFIPLGAPALLWFKHKWRGAAKANDATGEAAAETGLG